MDDIRPWSRAHTPLGDPAVDDETMDEAVSKAKRLAKIQERQKMYQYRHENIIDVMSWAKTPDKRAEGNRDHYTHDPLVTVPEHIRERVLREDVSETRRREIAATLGGTWNNPVDWDRMLNRKTETLARGGDIAGLRLHLLHMKPNLLDELRTARSSILHIPCATGNLAALILLVSEFNFSLTTVCPQKGALLHTAARHGLGHIVSYLLSYEDHISGLNVAAPDTHNTPLHEAAHNGSTDVMSQLLEAGAGVNKVNKQNESPLILACKHGNNAAARLVLTKYHHFLDVNILDVTNMNAAYYCIRRGMLDLLRLVTQRGGTLCVKGLYWSPVQLACRNATNHATALAMVRYLMEELGEAAQAEQMHGSAPACLAQKAGNTALVEYLMAQQQGDGDGDGDEHPAARRASRRSFAAALQTPTPTPPTKSIPAPPAVAAERAAVRPRVVM